MQFEDTALVTGIDDIQGVSTGELSISGSVYNRSVRRRTAVIEAVLQPVELLLGSTNTTLGKAVQRVRCELVVQPGQTSPFKLDHVFDNRLLDLLTVTVREEEKLLSSAAIPFVLKKRRYVEIVPLPEETHALVQVDLRRLKQVQSVNVHCDLRNNDGDDVLHTQWKGIRTGRIQVKRLTVTTLAPGDYDAVFRILAADTGKLLLRETGKHQVRQMPEWYRVGRTLGKSDKVIAPWTPMRRAGNVVQVWGRHYELGQSPLFEQIESRGELLLADPMRLTATVAGRPEPFVFGGRKFDAVKDHEINWSTRGRFGVVNVELVCHAEYDGMIRVDLMLDAKQTVTIEKLILRIPLRRAQSEYCHYAASYYDTAFSGYLPPEGLEMGFVPFLWTGSLRRGLMWFAPSTRGWNVGEKVLRIERGDSANDLTIRFIDQSLRLQGRRRIVFGLQGTPVKKLPQGWRGWTLAGSVDQHHEQWDDTPIQFRMINPHDRRLTKGRKAQWIDAQGRVIPIGHTTPLKANLPKLIELNRQYHARGQKTAYYEYLSGASGSRTTGFDRYHRTWQRVPTKLFDYGDMGVIHGSSLGSSYADLLLYGWQQLMLRTDMDGVYLDGGSGPAICRNPLLGHAWYREDSNQAQGEYHIFEARRFMQRLAVMSEEQRGAGNYVIWNHMSQCMAMPMLSFCTATLDGESPFSTVRNGGPTLPELTTLDYIRVIATGEHFGIVPTWLIYPFSAKPGRPEVLRATMALMLPHGTPCYPLGGVATREPERIMMQGIWRAKHAFDVGSADFHGYWENSDWLTVSPQDPKIICSHYARDGRYLLVLANLSKQARQCVLKLNASRLPLKGKSARDAISGRNLAIRGPTLTKSLGPEDFCLIVIE